MEAQVGVQNRSNLRLRLCPRFQLALRVNPSIDRIVKRRQRSGQADSTRNTTMQRTSALPQVHTVQAFQLEARRSDSLKLELFRIQHSKKTSESGSTTGDE